MSNRNLDQRSDAQLIKIFPSLVEQAKGSPVVLTPKELSKQRFMLPGNFIRPVSPHQKIADVGKMYDDAKDCSDQFKHLLQALSRKSGGTYKVVKDKIRGRTIDKAESDYGGDVSRVCDIVRGCIEFETPEQYARLVKLLLPGYNSNVVRFEDSLAIPDQDGGLRRLLVNYRMKNGHIVEIQGRHKGMEKAYDQTEGLWRRIRALQRRMAEANGECKLDTKTRQVFNLQSRLLRNNDNVLEMQAQMDSMMLERYTKHKAASDIHVSGWEVTRTFHLVDGFPVMEVTDPFQGFTQTVVPNFQTGTYAIDNAFIPLLADKRHHKIEDVPRGVFLAKAIAMVTPAQQLGGHLALVQH